MSSQQAQHHYGPTQHTVRITGFGWGRCQTQQIQSFTGGSVGGKNSSIDMKNHATNAVIGRNAPTNGRTNWRAGRHESS
jgi:hypothetical protein